MVKSRHSKESMKNLKARMNKRPWLVFSILILLHCSCSKTDSYSEAIAGTNGYYWDIIYYDNKYRKEPTQGYFFKPNGKYYSYHYYGKGRTPFDHELSDKSTPPTIKANLKEWSISPDTILQIGSFKYTIDYISKDTISLKIGVKSNSLIKLAKVK